MSVASWFVKTIFFIVEYNLNIAKFRQKEMKGRRVENSAMTLQRPSVRLFRFRKIYNQLCHLYTGKKNPNLFLTLRDTLSHIAVHIKGKINKGDPRAINQMVSNIAIKTKSKILILYSQGKSWYWSMRKSNANLDPVLKNPRKNQNKFFY